MLEFESKVLGVERGGATHIAHLVSNALEILHEGPRYIGSPRIVNRRCVLGGHHGYSRPWPDPQFVGSQGACDPQVHC